MPRSPAFVRALAEVGKAVGASSGLRVESRSASGAEILFYADRSDRPGRFILVGSGKSRTVGLTRPWLESRRLAPTEPVWITARDGLRLLAYVTRPVGQSRPGPTVIGIHGGPWSRDTGGFESTAQLLANRGYSVIQVNFRGSTGLGKTLFEGGVRQFGRAMSDDIDDTAKWAVGQRIAAPGAICLMGGSYGGYAVLAGLARPSSTYRCGVDYAGPVNLVTLVEAFPPSWGPFLPRSWYRFVGRPADPVDRRDMLERSPITAAAQIDVPLLVFQGANDPRVTQAQSDTIVCSIRKRSIAVDYLLASNEGHSFANEETSLAVNRATELFLGRHLGGRVQEKVAADVERALNSLLAAGGEIGC